MSVSSPMSGCPDACKPWLPWVPYGVQGDLIWLKDLGLSPNFVRGNEKLYFANCLREGSLTDAPFLVCAL